MGERWERHTVCEQFNDLLRSEIVGWFSRYVRTIASGDCPHISAGTGHRQATARTREVRRAGPGSNAAAHLSMSSLRLAQVAQAPPVAVDERQRSPQATATARRLLMGANLQIGAQHHAGPSGMSTHLNSEQARSGAAHRRDMLVHTQTADFPAAGMPHAASK